MAVPHAQPAEVIDISPLSERLSQAQTTTLVKTKSLEVIRLVLLAGKTIAAHSVPGEVTILCLEGSVEFEMRGQRRTLRPAAFLYLAGGDEHSVRALENASLLVTILLKPA